MTNNSMTIFLKLCDPFRQVISEVSSEEGWHSISHLSKLHGVTPFLYYRARSLGIKLPEQIEKEWLGIYLYQIAEEKKARQQIKELKEILDPEGIPFILLKGASAMLRLYPQSGLRTFVDLDILIPPDKVTHFKKVMTTVGYKPIASSSSPEGEELHKFNGHLNPFWKEKRFLIEPHVNILGGKGFHLIAVPEIWQEKEETNTDGFSVDHLRKETFVIHMLLHCAKDLSNAGFGQIKGLIDVLYALRVWSIDWSKVCDIAQKWGIEKDILPVIATLNQYWKVQITLPIASEPIAPDILVLGVKDQQKHYYAKLPASCLTRVLKTKELPNYAFGIRYLLHVLFPIRKNLRWRYGLSSKWSIVPYYFVHLVVTSRKIFAGLWYRVLYHPKTTQ